jgi:hypothetical protein
MSGLTKDLPALNPEGNGSVSAQYELERAPEKVRNLLLQVNEPRSVGPLLRSPVTVMTIALPTPTDMFHMIGH